MEYDAASHTLNVKATFEDLLGATTAAHIHCCIAAPGATGVATITPSFPLFPLGVTSGSFDETFDLTNTSSFNSSFVTASGGTATGAESVLSTGLANGQAYFNIHTTFVPGGEIRGFLATVPIPATAWLFGSGLLGLVGFGRGA